MNHDTLKPKSLQAHYTQLVKKGTIEADENQQAIIAQLSPFAAEMQRYLQARFRLFARQPRGIYLYGDVGRGKTFLMDLLAEHLDHPKVLRTHFHRFMLEMHEALDLAREQQRAKPMRHAADKLAKRYRLICLDELQILDIADAMIVGRVFQRLMEAGVVIMATSNRHPQDLYKDGLQRERFLPFIALIEQHCRVLNLDAAHDYRLRHMQALSTRYLVATGKEAEQFMVQSFAELTHHSTPEATSLTVKGRHVLLPRTHMDVAWCMFEELCARPLGAADYAELAQNFSTVLIQDIPQLSPDNRNEAKRFVTLIDELYNHHTNVICTAAARPDALYAEGKGSFEFARTASRLIEMQSDAYIAKRHV